MKKEMNMDEYYRWVEEKIELESCVDGYRWIG